MTRPLNPFLHERLTSVFESVQIRNEGESMRGRYVPDVKGRRFIVDVPGEYYVVSCPFCNDTRNRLWVNHVYGVPDQCGDSRFWAAHCFNEDCLSEPAYRKALITRVYGGISRDQRRSVRIRPGTIATSGQQFALPGDCPRVDQLPANDAAPTYLRERGLDPETLAHTHDVRFCEQAEPRFAAAQGRLVVPVSMRGKLVGWQARFPGEADWRITPKYYTCPGMKKTRCLYGFDSARQSPVVFLTEGVTDVWAIGNGAVALFGKSASVYQRDLIATTWRRGAAVVLLDHDARTEAARLTSELQRRLQGGAVHVELPAGSDPASLPRDVLWDLIWASCIQANIDLIGLLQQTKS